jgi:hypothetical protein
MSTGQTDSCIYNRARQYLDTGQASLTGPLKLALLSGYTPDREAHHTWSDISAHEITAEAYPPGGIAIQSPRLTRTGAAIVWTASPVVVEALTATTGHAVVYQDDAGQELIAVMALSCGQEVSLAMQDLRITLTATISVAAGS